MPDLCPAAYLWTLQLDAAGLAWEYLRRNPRYRATWYRALETSTLDCTPVSAWGLRALENPDLDARQALPQWRRQAEAVHLVADDHGCRFDLWRPPGVKRFVQHGGAWLGALGEGANRSWVEAPAGWEVADGFGFVLTSGAQLNAQLEAVRRFAAWSEGKSANPQNRKAAFDHMHRLIALDAKARGRTQRAIAALLTDAPGLEDWRVNSRHRMRVAYLIARGEALRDGEYRSLVGLDVRVSTPFPAEAESEDPALSA